MPLAHLTKSILIVTMICAIFAGNLAADTKNTFIVQPGQSSTKKIPSKLLDGVIALRVVQNDERVKGFKVRIGRRTSRETSVTISATRDTPIAVGFQLAALVAGSKTITLPYDVHVAGTRSLVDSYVNFHNDATDAGLEKALVEGWDSIDGVPAPDPDVISLDPTHAGALIDDMLLHLKSNSFGGSQLVNVFNLAAKCKEADLRRAAIETLGRSPDAQATPMLIKLYAALKEEKDKALLINTIQPVEPTDAVSQFMYRELKNSKTSSTLKKLILYRLLDMSLLAERSPGLSPPKGVVKNLPSSMQRDFRTSWEKRRGAMRNGFAYQKEKSLSSRGVSVSQLKVNKTKETDLILETLSKQKHVPHMIKFMVDKGGRVSTPPASVLKNPREFRQVLILATGYAANDYKQFLDDIVKLVSRLGNMPKTVYTSQHRDRIVYLVYWQPGGTFRIGNANYGARISTHPVQKSKKGLVLSNRRLELEGVTGAARVLQTTVPMAVVVLYNYGNNDAAAFSAPSMVTGQTYGVVRMTRSHLKTDEGVYMTMRRLAHASMQFMDESTQPQLDRFDIHNIDARSRGIGLTDTWDAYFKKMKNIIGQYDWRISDIIANNGAENVTTRSMPATVYTADHSTTDFTLEGGAFFGKGTWRHTGDNLMNNDRTSPNHPIKPTGDRFAFAHSPSQQNTLKTVFEPPQEASRPNNRLRNSGPLQDSVPVWGSQVRVMLHDGDKNHRWHPTKEYEVQVMWHAKEYETFPAGIKDLITNKDLFVPYVAKATKQTISRRFKNRTRTLNIRNVLLSGGATFMRELLIAHGVTEIPIDNKYIYNIFELSTEEITEGSLPPLLWDAPYQDIPIVAPNVNTTYYWRFRTLNSWGWSGWTSWAQFKRQ